MIRIYFDWNVFSNMKTPQFQEIKEFIVQNKKYLQFIYTPAHFQDLMKSYTPDNKKFFQDLDTLEFLAETHLLRWGTDGIEVLSANPKEYFEGEKDKDDIFSLMNIENAFEELDNSFDDLGGIKIGTLLKQLFQLQPSGIEINEENKIMVEKMFPNLKPNSTMWDAMKEISPLTEKLLQDKDYYKDLRSTIGEQGFKINPSVAGNWGYNEVIKNIDEYLLSFGTEMTYLEYVEATFKYKKEPINKYEYYTTAYLMLDMIGYKMDKLQKPSNNMQNIQTDGEHSFYGAYCDYFVASDKILVTKSKVLYNEFNISTKIIKPNQLISELEKVIHKPQREIGFIDEAISYGKLENLVETYPITEENEIEKSVFKLPKFYFNFFNYMIYEYLPNEEGVFITFKKVFKNFSRFVYYTETIKVLESITEHFGYQDKEERNEKIKQFTYEKEYTPFQWSFQNGLILLDKDEETNRPILSYAISTKENKENNA
jgi:hypothetical protein